MILSLNSRRNPRAPSAPSSRSWPRIAPAIISNWAPSSWRAREAKIR